VYFAYSYARIPMLMVDGSAHVRPTNHANSGFNPSNPRSPIPLVLTYTQSSYEPPILPAGGSNVTMYYYWTRGGIQGRDFEGPELDTSTW
jgi:hypothetical protein